MEVIVRFPGKDEPGYLQRAISFAELQDALRADQRDHGDITADSLRKMVDFFVPFVEIEGDPVDALMGLSENEFDQMMASFTSNPVPKESSEPSNEPSPDSQA